MGKERWIDFFSCEMWNWAFEKLRIKIWDSGFGFLRFVSFEFFFFFFLKIEEGIKPKR